MKTTSLLSTTALAVSLSLAAHADPATGWPQTAAGTYDYNDAANWVGGDINGVFGSDLTLAGNQTITFSQDTTLPDGLTFQYKGAYSITMTSDGSAARTLTLGGDLTFALGTNNDKIGVTIGSGTAASALNIDLGDATRSILAGGQSKPAFKLLNAISNGGLELRNNYPLTLNSANTYTAGTTLAGTGKVYVMPNAFGTGTVVFEQGAALDVSGNRTFTANNALVFNGDWTFSGTSGNLNLGTGEITISRPITISANKNTLTLGGAVVSGTIADITKAGNGTLTTTAGYATTGEAVLACTAGTWNFNGTLTATSLTKVGAGTLSLNAAGNDFGTDIRVAAGATLQIPVAGSIPANARILVEEGAQLRTTAAYPAGVLASMLHPASAGSLVLLDSFTGTIDFSSAPGMHLGIAGADRNFTGSIIAAEGAPYRFGPTSGYTLRLVNDGTLTGDHDVEINGKVSASGVNTVSGTISVARDSLFVVGYNSGFPNADVVATNATVQFNANGGEHVRLASLTLISSTLNLPVSSSGATTHVITGALKTGAGLHGGVSRITGDNATANPITLQMGSLEQADPSFLYVMCTPLGDPDGLTGTRVIATTAPAALAATGVAGSTTAPIVPWVRIGASGILAKHGASGLVAIDPATEQAAYADGFEGAAAPGENLLLSGAVTNTFTAGSSLNSIMAFSTAAGSEPWLTIANTMPILSGAIATYSEGAATIDAPLDFGDKPGYITFRKDKNSYLKGTIAGTGGLVFGDGNATVAKSTDPGFHIQSANCTFTGDVIVQNQIFIDSSTFLPSGPDRPGNLYLYAPLYRKGITLNINGLYGTGQIDTPGSNQNYITIGNDGSDGDFSGTIGGSNINLTLHKVGAGHQRFSGTVQFKYSSEIRGGTLQVDNLYYADRDGSSITVKNGAMLSGCGTLRTKDRRVIIESGATLAPGSEQIPNQAMTVDTELQMDAGSALRFYIDKERASQVIVSGAVTGTTGEIPVTIDGEAPPARRWLLMEAASFTSENFTLTGTRGSLDVVHVENGPSQLWYETAAEATVVLIH